eukprot:TRINITY_DN16754_c0_g1_i1.p1 TRINITY_DN16754_c0_g1~~TRINITY_DN16754_c0_g1_i1.p1  ORF type:complete len:595 (-),score=61.84 TRINITY_DN16754_c0_g1_i1:112-1827(-)
MPREWIVLLPFVWFHSTCGSRARSDNEMSESTSQWARLDALTRSDPNFSAIAPELEHKIDDLIEAPVPANTDKVFVKFIKRFTKYFKRAVSQKTSNVADALLWFRRKPTSAQLEEFGNDSYTSTSSVGASNPLDFVRQQSRCSGLYFIFRDWLVNVVQNILEGTLQSFTTLAKDILETGSLRQFLHSIWKMFKRVAQAPDLKRSISSLLHEAYRELHSCIGQPKHQSEDQLKSSLLEQGEWAPARSKATKGAKSTKQRKRPQRNSRKQSKRPQLSLNAGNVMQTVKKEKERTLGKKVPLLDRSLSDFLPQVFPSFIIKRLVPRKWSMLFVGIFVDLVGMLNALGVLTPPYGPVFAGFWWVFSVIWMNDFYDGSTNLASLSLFETFLPSLEVLPSACVAWLFSYNWGPGFATARWAVGLPERTQTGLQSCPMPTLQQLKRHYTIVKDNMKGHIYVKCRSWRKIFSWSSHKVSCLDNECSGISGFCFVPNHCGSEKKPCKEIDDQNPLKCSHHTDRKAEARKAKREDAEAERRRQQKQAEKEEIIRMKVLAAMEKKKRTKKHKGAGKSRDRWR